MMSKNDFVEKQIIIVNLRDGDKMCFSNDNLLVKDKSGKIKHQSTCHLLLAILVIGNFTITNAMIVKAKKFGFSIFFLSSSLRVLNSIHNGIEGNVLLHRKQYEYNSIEIGKRIIKNKIETERKALMLERKKTVSQKDVIKEFDNYLENFDKWPEDLNSLLSIEGVCAKKYFYCMFKDFDWEGRKPRTKCDIINACLDIGYSVLFNYIDMLLSLYDFDKYVGVLHKEFWKRKSLVCDLMEPFRCIIDRKIIKAINLKQINPDDFRIYENRYCLVSQKNSKYLSLFAEAIIEYKEELFKYIQQYYRSFVKGKDYEKYPWFELC